MSSNELDERDERVRRTIEQAEAIIAEEGAESWVGLDNEDYLGCPVEEHHEWLVSCDEDDLRGWARSVADES